MPQALNVDPQKTRSPHYLTLPPIPIHQETARTHPVGEHAHSMLVMYRDMVFIREFETMLGDLKAHGSYAGMSCTYRGPAHLSIGQEAAAVGMAAALHTEDHIFGTHRSHGEFIAKGLAAIEQLTEPRLINIMESHQEGRLWSALQKHHTFESARHGARQFLLSGLLTELFARQNGFNAGMGGSMHAFFPPFGIMPNNAIVGASAGIAAGSALFKKTAGSQSISVANIGDGATGCGPVWEALNFSAMGQFRSLWPAERRGGLPVLFLVVNNFYAMGGQTLGETMAFHQISQMGAAFGQNNLHAATIDGNNPLVVKAAVEQRRKLLLDGEGPALLDVQCYRSAGHSTTDGNVYRTRAELDAWKAIDPVREFRRELSAHPDIDPGALDEVEQTVKESILAVLRFALDEELSPLPDVAAAARSVGGIMFSNRQRNVLAGPRCTLDAPLDSVARVRQLSGKSRTGSAADGTKLSPRKAITIRDALFETILTHFQHDKRLIAYGEECREWGGAFGVYRGLSDLLPYSKLFNAPISEAAIIATAVGYGLEGGRALVELMYADFIGRAGDEIFNQLSKWQSMSGGTLEMPVVVRTSVGNKYGAQHSQDWSGLVTHIPGLKVVYPVTPYDAKGMLATAMSGSDPVIFFESQRLYETTEQFAPEGVPDDYYTLPFGIPAVRRAGSDLTVLTIGPCLYTALDAAEILTDRGVSAEIIDARTLVPFDYQPLLDSVSGTGRLLIVSEECERASFGATVAYTVQDQLAGRLKAPVNLLGAPNWIVPSVEMEQSYFPQAHDIVDRVNQRLLTVPGWEPTGTRNHNPLALAREGL